MLLLVLSWIIDSCLDFFEFFEHVLVVQKSVGELLFKHVCLQIVTNTLLDDWHVEYAVDAWTLARLLLEAHLNNIFQRK